ncbi:MAG: hypothetical protein KDA92_01200, partial [Planctomycetales bacterium]|nr:hypothetical protein [Planctomycetales bacterium]
MSSGNLPEQSTTDTERTERVRQVIEDCMDRRAAGASVTDAELIANHSDLMPELDSALRFLRLAETAEQHARHLAAAGLHVRCPHCQIALEVVEESSVSDLTCPSCGSRLSLTDDSERTFRVDCEEMVNHFRLVERVGVGAFGGVWRAHDTQLDRTVALKVPRKGQMDPEDQEQFIREAR